MFKQIWSGGMRVLRRNPGQAGEHRLKRSRFAPRQMNFEFLESRVLLSGNILREYWTNITGNNISSLITATNNFTTPPSSSQYITSLETQSQGDYYGDRIRGYITAPQTGAYTFWVAGDDEVQLYLSNDKDPAHKKMVAWVPTDGHTGFEEWNKYPTQQSAKISLVAGQQYYIEILHKEGGGSDSESVRWQLPDGTVEGPIPGSRLTPFVPQVDLYTLDDNADKGTGKVAQVQVVRTDDLGQDLTVNYTLGGTAVNGTDYSTLSGTVVIPKGSTSATITLTPIANANTSNLTATIKLAAGSNYTLGTQSSGSSTINIRYGKVPTSGGTSLLPANPYTSYSSNNTTTSGTINVVNVTGQQFSQAFEINTPANTTSTSSLSVWWPKTTYATSDTALASMWIRNVGPSDYAALEVLVQTEWRPDGYKTAADVSFFATNQWQQIFIPFNVPINGDYRMNLRLGFSLPQTIQIGGISLANYGTATTVAALPQSNFNYMGRDADQSWRDTADAGIDANRKGDLTVQVKDSAGHVIPGALVTVNQTSHSFGFGSAINTTIWDTSTTGQNYRDMITSLYNIAVDEGALKWSPWLKNQQIGIDDVNWVTGQGLKMRGHNLVWPSWALTPSSTGASSGTYGTVDWAATSSMPASQAEYLAHVSVDGTATANAWLEQRILDHITQEMTALKGKISEWDVVNEIVNNHDLTDTLGKSVIIDWYNAAKAADPNARLMLNDAHILANDGVDYAHVQGDYDWLKYLQDNGAPIEGFGFQGHFTDSWLTPMGLVSQILSKYDALNIGLDITEFDVTSNDQQLQADYMRDFFKMAFADPHMNNILTWGFWAGADWSPSSALYNLDWSIKPNGQVWKDLVQQEWTTNATGTTWTDGTYTTRGFDGNYNITVTYNGQTMTVSNASLDSNGKTITVTLNGNQAPTITSPASSSASPVTGTTTTLSVQATDPHPSPNLSYSWTTTGTPPAPVTYSANGMASSNNTTVTFAKAGTYHFLVTVTDNAGLSTTSAVDVVVQQTLTNIPSVSPSNTPTVAPGATVQFSAVGTDQFGDTMPVNFWWSTTGSSNTINSSTGVFTAGNTAGTYRVSVASGSIHSSALITVDPFTASSDIGSVGVAGSSALSTGTYTITGSGSDIWGTADTFRYTYVPFSGDGEIVAQVASVQYINTWSKAGVMFRNSLSADSAYADIVVTPASGIDFEYRTSAGASASHAPTVTGVAAPYWVKLVRSGDKFLAYRSADGSAWTQIGSAITISMGSTIYVGLAVTAHNNSLSCTATFNNVTVTHYTNLASGKTVTASSTAAGSSTSFAVDGNTSTTWTSSASGSQWMTVDLSTVRTVSRVTLNWGANYASNYSVQVSTDNTNWTSLYSTTSGNGSLLDLAALNLAVRYLRVSINSGSFANDQIGELTIFGT